MGMQEKGSNHLGILCAQCIGEIILRLAVSLKLLGEKVSLQTDKGVEKPQGGCTKFTGCENDGGS